MTADTAFDTTTYIIIDRGSSSVIFPLPHYPFCYATHQEVITKSSGDRDDLSHHFESKLVPFMLLAMLVFFLFCFSGTYICYDSIKRFIMRR